MTNFEMVEEVVRKTGVTFEEAKSVLEQNNWDMLDAIIQLEKQGNVTRGARTGNVEKVHSFCGEYDSKRK